MTTRLSRIWITLIALLGLVSAGNAGATAFTIDVATPINTGGVLGSINPVLDLSGTPDETAGTVSDFSSQDWLIVDITLSAGSDAVDQIGISAVGETAIGAGFYDDLGFEKPTDADEDNVLVSSGAGLFNYEHLDIPDPGNLEAGETTVRLFAAFASGDLPGAGLPPVIPAGTASFMISAGASVDSPQASIVPVPEPNTALLLALGLGALATRARRAGRRS